MSSSRNSVNLAGDSELPTVFILIENKLIILCLKVTIDL